MLVTVWANAGICCEELSQNHSVALRVYTEPNPHDGQTPRYSYPPFPVGIFEEENLRCL